MRIGDLDDLHNTKSSENQGIGENPGSPDESEFSERQKKWKNWWYYYKWYVICGVILLGIIINVAGSYLGLWTKAPDFQVAYVGRTQLPAATVSAVEQAFASLASDFNGDGDIIVKVNQYINGTENAAPETSYYEYASEISLIGDISDCESYFFLMDDPDQFQRDFQLLACPDGSCPGDTDYSTQDKVIPWSSCPLLTGMELGSYSSSILGKEVSGDNQELLSGLYIGRRCFFTDNITKHADECNNLWNTLYNSGL